MAAKRITQETFDSVVQENISEFGMDPEEAVVEAVQQFESQGTACGSQTVVLIMNMCQPAVSSCIWGNPEVPQKLLKDSLAHGCSYSGGSSDLTGCLISRWEMASLSMAVVLLLSYISH